MVVVMVGGWGKKEKVKRKKREERKKAFEAQSDSFSPLFFLARIKSNLRRVLVVGICSFEKHAKVLFCSVETKGKYVCLPFISEYGLHPHSHSYRLHGNEQIRQIYSLACFNELTN